ncbi:MAG TPA: hypothetical protein VGL71_02905, partial [Urbifossiella sp.]
SVDLLRMQDYLDNSEAFLPNFKSDSIRRREFFSIDFALRRNPKRLSEAIYSSLASHWRTTPSSSHATPRITPVFPD